MKVVGIDFGTTNVRISTWDPDTDEVPETLLLRKGGKGGKGGETTMPAVVALHRRAGGEVAIVVGEEADEAYDDPNETLVISNIKRYALSNDSYVDWHLEVRNAHEQTSKWPPTWWNPNTRCVEVWGREFPVWELISCILAEALVRAEIADEFEWRAGCPVHAGYDYRTELAATLRGLSGNGDAKCVVEEPVLLMTLAHRLGDLRSGSYLVYDFGGGSFDCAVVEIGDDGQMIVYGADGHPLLGGSDIDERLSEKLGYTGQSAQLRQAKERRSPQNPSETVGGTVVTLDNLMEVLYEGKFFLKSLMTMHDTYIAAKVLWKRGEGVDDPPVGEVITRNRETGGIGFVWQEARDSMKRDLDEIILFGGTTRFPHFRERLSDLFSGDKLRSIDQLLPRLTGESDLELTAVSKGACYSYRDPHAPLYSSRLSARIILEDMESGERVEYEPFQHFTNGFRPFGDFISEPLHRDNAVMRSSRYPETYELSITYPNNALWGRKFIDDDIDKRRVESTLRLVIDRYGTVGIIQEHPSYPPMWYPVYDALRHDLPWHTDAMRDALRKKLEQQRRYEQEERERGALLFGRHPWQYPTP